MIDRGPDSAGLIEFIRSDNRIICLKGNHELMAVSSLQEDGRVELWQPWLARGGRSTWGSYIVRAEGDLYEAKRLFADDLMWMDNLPNHIVLDKLRLVHAGYDPRMPLDSQGDKELLWIRKRFYEHEYAIDPYRTVIFGHSTTTKVGPAPGEVVHSPIKLNDERPAWIAMDIGAYNHVSPGLAAMNLSSFRIVKQGTLRSERWFDFADCKEAKVGSHYGLDLLQNRNRREEVSAIRAKRKLKKAGVVLREERKDIDLEDMPRHLLFSSKEYDVENKWMLLDQETNQDERHLRLQGPTGFRVYRRKKARTSLGSESIIQRRRRIQG
jgi:hypothetical protein